MHQPSPPSATPKLWELSQDIIELENAFADLQDHPDLSESKKDQQIHQLFEEWLRKGEKFEEKAVRVAAWIRQQEALAEARRQEAQRLRELAQQAQKQAERLKGYLTRQMLKTGKTKIEGVSGKLFLRQKPTRIVLHTEPEELPLDFVRVTYEPRLSEIRQYLQSHSDVTWASFGPETEFSLIFS